MDGEDPGIEVEADSFPLDRYLPLGELGRGASGTVYLCRDRVLGKEVAVKVLHLLTAEQLLLFQDEARALSKLEHHNIVSILDFGATDSGVPFMVLEHFPGENLTEYLERSGVMDEDTARQVFGQIMEGLAYSHSRGIFHRDLKPNNFMLRNAGTDNLEVEVKIIDFGVARVAELSGRVTEYQGRTLAGTPFYMSPDVINGHAYSRASEVYSLGCVLFEALTGMKPFEADSALGTLALHAEVEAPRLSDVVDHQYSKHIEEFLAQCLEKDPEKRFATMEEAQQRLAQYPSESTGFFQAPKRPVGALSSARKPKPAVFLIGAMAVSLIGFLVIQAIFSEPEQIPGDAKNQVVTDSLEALDFKDVEYPRQVNIGGGVAMDLSSSGLDRLSLRNVSLAEFMRVRQAEGFDLEHFEIVDMRACVLDDPAFFEAIGSAPRLTTLKIEMTAPGTIAAGPMKAFFSSLDRNQNQNPNRRSFSHLLLAAGSIDREVFDLIARHGQIRFLEIKSRSFDDTCLAKLADLPLRGLNIAMTGVSDAGLRKLEQKMKGLRRLFLPSSDRLSEKAILDFRAGHPYCSVEIVTEEHNAVF
ncbi:MAG: serine/threonine protein kinase [Candidatus Melainabacteria bacterium]|nr:serine/threonine protein kinase [Candidatus Melainabacteria bacterium]